MELPCSMCGSAGKKGRHVPASSPFVAKQKDNVPMLQMHAKVRTRPSYLTNDNDKQQNNASGEAFALD